MVRFALLSIVALAAFGPRTAAGEGDVLVSTDWLAAHIDDTRLVLVHVEFGREAPDALARPMFHDGHIPFAKHLEWGTLATTRDGVPNEFPPAAEMAVMRPMASYVRVVVSALPSVSLVTAPSAETAVAVQYTVLGVAALRTDARWP